MAALDMEEAVLKTVFPDGNYLDFHRHLYFVYEKRTELELNAGDYDKAMEYLEIMVDHVKIYAELCKTGEHRYTSDVFDRLIPKFAQDGPIKASFIIGDENNTKPFMEQIRADLMTGEKYAPLRDCEDFRALFE